MLIFVDRGSMKITNERNTNPHLQAYDNYQLISSSLPEATEACIDSAGHEFDASRQHRLLRAATYGLAFCRSIFSPLYGAIIRVGYGLNWLSLGKG
jgi:hypothetical protein